MNKYYKAPNLFNFSHGFFSKNGGVSEGVYESLNCGKLSKDAISNIEENRSIIANILNFEKKNLVIANQHHSNKVCIIDTASKGFKCDALITVSKDLTLGVLTADCCPILIGHKNSLIVGTIHLGWKGLLNGIIENFILEIKNLNLKLSDLLVALGPCIGKKSYEVDSIFFNQFYKKDSKCLEYFIESGNYKFYFDIRGYAIQKLKNNGITNIWQSKEDTYIKNNEFFSFRYAKHNNYNDYGRMLSVIKI